MCQVIVIIAGSRLVIGFIAHLQIAIRNNYSAIANSLEHELNPLSLLFLYRLSPGNGFERRRFTALHPRWLSPISLHLPIWITTAKISTQLDSTPVYKLNSESE
jgi:hypothetical protein